VYVLVGMIDYTSLRVWHSSQNFFLKVHELSYHSFFSREFYLKNQLLRATLSIHLNIAEGSGRGRDKEFAYFLRISRGSLDEVMSLLYILEKLQPGVFHTPALIEEAKKLKISLNALLSKTSTSEKRKHHSVKKHEDMKSPASS
jgi:four helix bundle protein